MHVLEIGAGKHSTLTNLSLPRKLSNCAFCYIVVMLELISSILRLY